MDCEQRYSVKKKKKKSTYDNWQSSKYTNAVHTKYALSNYSLEIYKEIKANITIIRLIVNLLVVFYCSSKY